MGVVAILDPRNKTDLLEYYYGVFYGNGVNDQVKSIRQLCYDLLYDYQSDSCVMTSHKCKTCLVYKQNTKICKKFKLIAIVPGEFPIDVETPSQANQTPTVQTGPKKRVSS
ncbi:unnamed protein product [Lathyrus oleraceus]